MIGALSIVVGKSYRSINGTEATSMCVHCYVVRVAWIVKMLSNIRGLKSASHR